MPRQAAKRRDLHTLAFLDWLSCFAIAVNEENACGGACRRKREAMGCLVRKLIRSARVSFDSSFRPRGDGAD